MSKAKNEPIIAKKEELKISHIRTTSSVRIGNTQFTSFPVTNNLIVTKKGSVYFIYDKASKKTTELPYHSISYIQYEPSENSDNEAGHSDSNGSETSES